MIGLIGEQEDAIGFGLAGVQHIQEVPPQASDEELLRALDNLQGNIEVLLIQHPLHQRIKEHTKNLMVIEIPTNNDKAREIEALSKELLGIEL